MNSHEIVREECQGIPVLKVRGYCSKEGGDKLAETIEACAVERKVFLVLDFSECKVINSPGVAALMDISLRVFDDLKGKLVLIGLDTLKRSVLQMARIIPMVPTAESLPQALELLKASQ